jgi:hypothetical protein
MTKGLLRTWFFNMPTAIAAIGGMPTLFVAVALFGSSSSATHILFIVNLVILSVPIITAIACNLVEIRCLLSKVGEANLPEWTDRRPELIAGAWLLLVTLLSLTQMLKCATDATLVSSSALVIRLSLLASLSLPIVSVIAQAVRLHRAKRES